MAIDRYQKLQIGRLLLSDRSKQQIQIFKRIDSHLLALLLERLVDLFDVVIQLRVRGNLLHLMVHLLQIDIENPVSVLQVH